MESGPRDITLQHNAIPILLANWDVSNLFLLALPLMRDEPEVDELRDLPKQVLWETKCTMQTNLHFSCLSAV